MIRGLIKFSVLFGLSLGILLLGSTLYLWASLPPIGELRHTPLTTPMRIYANSGELIGEFGEKIRQPLKIDQLPTDLINAFIVAEDRRFYHHLGVDIFGLIRAGLELAKTGRIQTGGSTITMQVARNFFLSRARTFKRKINEILLAIQIELVLSKRDILELYLNKIYLGKKAYGVASAANIYYDKDIADLSLAERAMIAGLPKAPSKYNPISNPARAKLRRNWILRNMSELGYIDEEQYLHASTAALTAKIDGSQLEYSVPYISEMVRQEMVKRFGRNFSYENGLKVYTTIDVSLQKASDQAVFKGLLDYDWRHGWRGAEGKLPSVSPENLIDMHAHLKTLDTIKDLIPGIVVAVDNKQAQILLMSGITTLSWENQLKNTRLYIDNDNMSSKLKSIRELLSIGDIIRLRKTKKSYQLTQIPTTQSLLVALNPWDGSILALTGGFNGRFNRVIQAHRQPGSSFKPLLYATALANGFTAATLINDAPVVLDDKLLEDIWRPENDSGQFFGPTRLRRALYKSRNLVSIRILRSLGIDNARRSISKFGFKPSSLPRDLTLALGNASVTPMSMVRAYSVFANGGYKITPYFIKKIVDGTNKVIYQAEPKIAKPAFENLHTNYDEQPIIYAERILDPRVAYITHTILQDVIKKGTGIGARALKDANIAGKTGTTNGPRDVWFSGYSSDIVATTWLGFDDNSLIGRREYGGKTALPIWIDFMKVALKLFPSKPIPQPTGIINVKIDSNTGKRIEMNQESGYIYELFLQENAPVFEPTSEQKEDSIINQLF